MKKNQILLCAFAVVGCLASCTKEATAPDSGQQTSEGKVAMTFTACGEASEAFKSFIQNDLSVAWMDADQIAVYDGTAKNVFSIASNEGASATFRGEVTEGATDFYAAYPADAATALNAGVITTSIPSEQIVPKGKNIGEGALVSVAHYADGKLSFKNVPGLFKFTIADNDITSVTIATMGGEALSGSVNVTVSASPSAEVVAGNSYVTVKPAAGTFATGDYYAAVIPGTYASGLSVVMTRSTDIGGVMQSNASATIARNDGLNLRTLAPTEWGTYITTLAQLRNWSKSGDFNKAAILGADIEVGEWASYFRAEAFNGNFYGLGHKLYNITCEPGSGPSSFLYQPKKEVSNLFIGTKDGCTYDGVSKFTLGSSTNGYCGLFTYTATNTVVKNVVNYATFEAATTHTGTNYVRIASFCGATNGGAFINCKNYGSVICNAQTTGGEANVGGLFGFIDQGLELTAIDCENHGDIVNNCSRALNIGGISGRTSGSTPVTYTRVKNYGKVTVNAGQTGDKSNGYIAGIIPYSYKNLTMDSCENHGELIVNYAPSTLYVTGLIGYLTGSATISSCENHGELVVNNAPGTLYLAGLIGYITGSATISKCANKTAISCDMSASTYFGGIVACAYSSAGKVELSQSTNDAAICASSTKFTLVSGICGYARNIIITECVNNAKVSIENASSTAKDGMVAGGIIGYSNTGVTFNNNENKGEVLVNTNTSSHRVAAGGIFGDCVNVAEAKSNCNYAAVTAINVNTGSSSEASAGGILGGDYYTSGNLENWMEDNTNYGNITAQAASGLDYAGGIAGKALHVRFYRMWNYGAISGTDLSTTGSAFGVATYSYAFANVGGSVNGTALTEDNWTTYIMGTSSTATWADGQGSFVSL